MFSGYAALTIETLREQRLMAERRQRELDAEEVRMLEHPAPAVVQTAAFSGA